MREGECPDLCVDYCGCPSHQLLGVEHLVPCCDKPHITEEEYNRKWVDVEERVEVVKGEFPWI